MCKIICLFFRTDLLFYRKSCYLWYICIEHGISANLISFQGCLRAAGRRNFGVSSVLYGKQVSEPLKAKIGTFSVFIKYYEKGATLEPSVCFALLQLQWYLSQFLSNFHKVTIILFKIESSFWVQVAGPWLAKVLTRHFSINFLIHQYISSNLCLNCSCIIPLQAEDLLSKSTCHRNWLNNAW